MNDQRRPSDGCRHEWVATVQTADTFVRTPGSRCLHCGRYSYRPSPPRDSRRPYGS